MGEVVGIDRKPYSPPAGGNAVNPDLLGWAESLVEKIKAGDVIGFVAVANCSDNAIIHIHAGEVRRVAVVGGLSYMQQYLNREIGQLTC